MEEIHYIKNRIFHILENEIDGKTFSFNVNDIKRLYDQLLIEEQQNEILIKELMECETSNVLLTIQNDEKDKIINSQKNDLKWNTDTYNKLRDEANNRGVNIDKLNNKINEFVKAIQGSIAIRDLWGVIDNMKSNDDKSFIEDELQALQNMEDTFNKLIE